MVWQVLIFNNALDYKVNLEIDETSKRKIYKEKSLIIGRKQNIIK